MNDHLAKYMTKDMIWKVALAVVGIVATGFVIEEVIGGAIGWIICGAILGATCYPLFKTLLERRGIAPRKEGEEQLIGWLIAGLIETVKKAGALAPA